MFGFFEKKEEVNYSELIKQRAIILDVRSKAEFDGGHIKGAMNIPLDVLSSNMSKIGNKNTCIVACCMSGGRSGVAKNILNGEGYNNVYNGGGWQQLQSKIN